MVGIISLPSNFQRYLDFYGTEEIGEDYEMIRYERDLDKQFDSILIITGGSSVSTKVQDLSIRAEEMGFEIETIDLAHASHQRYFS